jgi:hypothetical protein
MYHNENFAMDVSLQANFLNDGVKIEINYRKTIIN